MGGVIGDILPLAIVVAISPVPIIAVILILFSARARTNGPAFLAGWVVGLAVLGTVVLVLSDAGDLHDQDGPSTAAGVVQLILGVLLLLASLRQWRSRPKHGEEPEMPKWLAGVDGLSPVKAAGLGVLLSAVNPKNLLLVIAAAVTIGQAGLGTGQQVVALVVFVLVGSVTVALAVVYSLLGGEGAAARLEEAKDWLAANNATVMFILLLVFGVVLIGKAIGILSS
jgi:threonine/homoserine/homoserine lactone efflux protein